MERIVTVNLPDIGEGVVEGEIVQWLKKVGDPLKLDEPVVVVMTDKATVELPSPEEGVLREIFWKEGQLAIRGKPLYSMTCLGPSDTPVEVSEKKATKEEPIGRPTPNLQKGEKVLASPATRHLAKMLGVSMDAILPTGPHGEVTPEDVKGCLLIKSSKKNLRREGDEVIPLRGIQWLMAETMIKSHAEVPQFTYVISYDPTALRLAKEKFAGATLMPFFIKAWAITAKEFPFLNASVDADQREIYVHPHVDMGIAVDSPQGLLLPVLKGADTLNFSELVKAFDKLKEGARKGDLSPDAMRGGTVSLSNFGTLGGILGTPLIPYSQTSLLGIGKMEECPVVRQGKIEIGYKQYLSLSCDHRIVDGATAARAAERLVALLSDPGQWLK